MHIDGRILGALACVLIAMSATGRGVAGAERVAPVPLGGTTMGQPGDHSYGVYVPTRHGGTLTVKAGAGVVEDLKGPDGRPRINGRDVGGPHGHGWYTFRVSGGDPSRPYAIETTFVQVGQAARMPWNFYYWPTKGDSIHEPWSGGNGRVDTPGPAGDDIMVASQGAAVAPGQDIILPGANGLLESRPAPGDTSTWFPNLYDDLTYQGPDGTLYQTPSPLLKYDQLFGLSARNWEAANSQNLDIQRWPGHCLGGAVASIMLDEPRPAPGTGLSRDELKALWEELGENHYNHRIGDNANNIPPGPPRPGPDECDAHAPRFHAMLEQHIRARGQALLTNLRAFPPTGKPGEVWNHGVGKYTATIRAIPGEGPRRVRIGLELVGNTGSSLNEKDPAPRINSYEYILTYGLNGDVDETPDSYRDWISAGGDAMYAPMNLMEVAESRWQGQNPMVTEANVRSLDLANGVGDGPRNANSPPTFRPVAAYEAGRPPLFSPRMTTDAPNSPRRALLRLFGRD